MAMEFILRVAGGAPADQTAEFLGRAEAAGFTGVGFPDTQLIMRDVYVMMALGARSTSNLKLYTAVTNPVTRHVSVLASLVQTVEELAPGRVEIIVGSGYSAVRTIGQRAATLREMRECVVNLRRLLAGERVDLDGFEAHLPYASGRHIPILMAATGPRTIELAGEVADGALLAVGLHPAMIDRAEQMLAVGAEKAGRDPGSLETIYVARTHVADDMKIAEEMARPICVQWAIEPYRVRWLREAGLEIPEIELPAELKHLYPDIPHAENWEEACRLTSFMPDQMVADICEVSGLYGTTDYIATRLDELEKRGVKRLLVQTLDSYELPESTLTAFQQHIFPRLSG